MLSEYAAKAQVLRWRRPLRVLGLLTAAVLVLGAHYSRGRRDCTPPECQPPASPTVTNLLAGNPTAAILRGWSPSRSFRRVTVSAWGRMATLDSASLLTILKVNRVDLTHARRGVLLVPDSIAPEERYSPLPDSLPDLADFPKFVVVSRRVQAFGAYVNGHLVRWGPTSTGKAQTPTDSGLFFTTWKSRTTISTDDPSWVLDWYVNFMALKGVAFHQYGLPGRPASHGCVRLLEEDARWIYAWADQWVPGRGSRIKRYGTPVLVMGEYDYGAPAPWLALAEDPLADSVSTAEVGAALGPYLESLAAHRGDPRTLAVVTGGPRPL
jgi:L,D-transpeptidase catalytic domain